MRSIIPQEVDLVVAPLARTPEREMMVDFTSAFYLDYNTALVRYPDPEATKWRLYINPFRWQVRALFKLFGWQISHLLGYSR